MKRFFISALVTVLLLVAALGLTIAFGGPSDLPPMASINDPFSRVDFSDLPAVSSFAARDGTRLAFRAYPAAGAVQGSVVLVHGSSAIRMAIAAVEGMDHQKPDEAVRPTASLSASRPITRSSERLMAVGVSLLVTSFHALGFSAPCDDAGGGHVLFSGTMRADRHFRVRAGEFRAAANGSSCGLLSACLSLCCC